jgi:putative ABC transport system permease protein
MSLFHLAIRNILRRRLRTGLTLCGVAVGIAAFVSLVGFSRSFEDEWLKLYRSAGTDITVVRGTSVNSSISEDVGARIRALPEVADVAPIALNVTDLTPEINAVIYGWQEDSFEMDPLVILQGRRFRAGAAEVMVGEVLAESLGKKLGDRLEIQGTSFEIVAMFRGVSAFETGGALMPLAQLQRISDMGRNVTAYHVRLRPARPGESAEAHIQEIRAKIQAMVPGIKAVAAADMARNNQVLVLARSMAWGTSFIALLVSALGIANTMAMSVFERTREIGILRALGWKCGRVMRMILVESAVLGLVGGVLGIFLGWGALRFLATLRTTANVAQSSIPVLHSVQALAVALLIGLVSGLVPAYRGARLSPVEALRHD